MSNPVPRLVSVLENKQRRAVNVPVALMRLLDLLGSHLPGDHVLHMFVTIQVLLWLWSGANSKKYLNGEMP